MVESIASFSVHSFHCRLDHGSHFLVRGTDINATCCDDETNWDLPETRQEWGSEWGMIPGNRASMWPGQQAASYHSRGPGKRLVSAGSVDPLLYSLSACPIWPPSDWFHCISYYQWECCYQRGAIVVNWFNICDSFPVDSALFSYRCPNERFWFCLNVDRIKLRGKSERNWRNIEEIEEWLEGEKNWKIRRYSCQYNWQ